MYKIISLVIAFLNKINNFIWKIIIFLSKFIKVDEFNHLDDKPDDVKYPLFNIDAPAIIEPFAKSNLSKIIISSQLNAVMAKILLFVKILMFIFCRNDKCLFYLKNKSSMNVHDINLYQQHPQKFNLLS